MLVVHRLSSHLSQRGYAKPLLTAAASKPRYIQHPAHQNLLDLLRLLTLTSSPHSLGSRLGVHNVVPPPKAARIVANEALVVGVMVIGTSPERQEVVQTPREFVAAVCIDGLEETEDNPEVHGQDV